MSAEEEVKNNKKYFLIAGGVAIASLLGYYFYSKRGETNTEKVQDLSDEKKKETKKIEDIEDNVLDDALDELFESEPIKQKVETTMTDLESIDFIVKNSPKFLNEKSLFIVNSLNEKVQKNKANFEGKYFEVFSKLTSLEVKIPLNESISKLIDALFKNIGELKKFISKNLKKEWKLIYYHLKHSHKKYINDSCGYIFSILCEKLQHSKTEDFTDEFFDFLEVTQKRKLMRDFVTEVINLLLNWDLNDTQMFLIAAFCHSHQFHIEELKMMLTKVRNLNEQILKMKPESIVNFFITCYSVIPEVTQKHILELFPYLVQMDDFTKFWGIFQMENCEGLSMEQINLILKKAVQLIQSNDEIDKHHAKDILLGYYDHQNEKIREMLLENNFIEITIKMIKKYKLIGSTDLRISFQLMLSRYYDKLLAKKDFKSIEFLFNDLLNNFDNPAFPDDATVQCMFFLSKEIYKVSKELEIKNYNFEKFLNIYEKLLNNPDNQVVSVYVISTFPQIFSESIGWKEIYSKSKNQLLSILDQLVEKIGISLSGGPDSMVGVSTFWFTLKKDTYPFLSRVFKKGISCLKKDKSKASFFTSFIFISFFQSCSYFGNLMDPFLSHPDLLELTLDYTSHQNDTTRFCAYLFLNCYLQVENNVIEDSISKIKIMKQYEPKKSEIPNICLLAHIGLKYGCSFLDKDIDEMIERTTDHFMNNEIYFDSNGNSGYSSFLTIGIFTQLYFDKISKVFDKFGEKFGKKYLESLKGNENENPFEQNLLMDSFSKLFLSNQSFYHNKLFPNKFNY
eukprot:gene3226-5541_t